MANDAPKLHGFTFTHHPMMNVRWEAQLVTHQLSDGTKAVYNKGFILKGELEFGKESWINQAEYSAIEAMYNQLTGTAQFYPKPDTYPTRKFNVQFTNAFNFAPHQDRLRNPQDYEGVIEFESSIGDMVATATSVL